MAHKYFKKRHANSNAVTVAKQLYGKTTVVAYPANEVPREVLGALRMGILVEAQKKEWDEQQAKIEAGKIVVAERKAKKRAAKQVMKEAVEAKTKELLAQAEKAAKKKPASRSKKTEEAAKEEDAK